MDSPFVSTAAARDGGVRPAHKDHDLHVLWGVALIAVVGVLSDRNGRKEMGAGVAAGNKMAPF